MAEVDPYTPSETIVSGVAAQLSRRYATALYDLAVERKAMDVVAVDVRTLLHVWVQNPELRSLASNPRLKRAQLVQAMQATAVAAKIGALTSNFLGLLADSRRLALLPAIADSFLKRLAAERGEHAAFVTSATAFNAKQTEQLVAELAKMAGGKVHVSFREDKNLLGGFMVKMGSRLIDASVRGKLLRLERQLKSQSLSTVNTQKGAA